MLVLLGLGLSVKVVLHHGCHGVLASRRAISLTFAIQERRHSTQGHDLCGRHSTATVIHLRKEANPCVVRNVVQMAVIEFPSDLEYAPKNADVALVIDSRVASPCHRYLAGWMELSPCICGQIETPKVVQLEVFVVFSSEDVHLASLERC